MAHRESLPACRRGVLKTWRSSGTYRLAESAPRDFGTWVKNKADSRGDATAVVAAGRAASYGALDAASDRLAGGLARLGIEQHENVCVLMPTRLEAIEIWFALAKLGAVEVPVNPGTRGASLQYVVGHCGARVVVVDESVVERLAAVAGELPDLEHVVVCGEPRATSWPKGVAVHDLEELRVADLAPRVCTTWNDPAVILYTSGTTGPPKGVVLSHEAGLNLGRHTTWMMGYRSDDVLYTVFPLFHVNARYTSVVAAMEANARVVLDDRFSASRFWDICREHAVTAFNYQGALLTILWKQPRRLDDADNDVRVAMGAPCPVEIWEPFEERFGLHLVEIYGMTEVPIVTQNLLEDRRIGSCGKPSGNYEVALLNEDGVAVGDGEVGEIVVRPRRPGIIVREYFRQPEATADALRDCWFHTGDRGRFDGDGFLYFVDRKKDMIRRRGENVSSWEVEQVVCQLPWVADCAAYGVASELSEEDVMVAVIPQPHAARDPRAVIDHCQEHLPYFALPRYVRFCEEFPRTPSQRVEKHKLRAEGVTDETWDRELEGYEVTR